MADGVGRAVNPATRSGIELHHLSVLRVDPQRDGSVVHERYEHVLAEAAGGNFNPRRAHARDRSEERRAGRGGNRRTT
jgi:hypothetical protein